MPIRSINRLEVQVYIRSMQKLLLVWRSIYSVYISAELWMIEIGSQSDARDFGLWEKGKLEWILDILRSLAERFYFCWSLLKRIEVYGYITFFFMHI